MSRACALLLVVAGVVVLLALGAAVLLVRGGISARSEPSGLESSLARRLRHWAIPAEARARANPEPATPEVARDGRAHFADHCAQCHGNDGAGDTPIGRGLYPRSPDMRLPATQELSDGEIFWIIENGVRLTGMPGWGGPGSERASWHLVHFMRHLPKLTPEDKHQMEVLNPKSPDEWRELEDENVFLRGDAAPTEREDGGNRGRATGPHRHAE